MNKEFLDYIYNRKFILEEDIKRLDRIKNFADDADVKAHHAELRTRRSELAGINNTIVKYINTHK